MKDNKNNKKKESKKELRLDEFLSEEGFDEEDEDSVTDDTLEFLCLDDETIETYENRRVSSGSKASLSQYEENDDDECEDEEDDYEDDDDEYEDEEDDFEDDDDEYEDDDYEDDEYEYDDERGGVIVRFKRYLAEMSTLDMVVAMLGIVVIVGAFMSGALYVNAKSIEKQVAMFESVGEEIEGISVIGENGLVAVSESAKLSGMIALEQETEEAAEPETEADENEQDKGIEITLNLTSIQSDLKIKFVNKATGKLIGGVPFEVEVSNGKKTFDLKDEDKDGIIYQTGIDAGTYEVTVKPFKDQGYERYKLPASAASVKVTDTIAYKKVEVADEVKTEAEVNAAIEDTAAQNTEIESSLQDTVEWVESTKTPIGSEQAVYEEVDKNNIPDPWTVSSAFRKMVQEGTENAEEDPANITVSLNKDNLVLDKGETATLKVSVSGSSLRYTVEWNSSDTSVATVSDGTVSAVGVGNANISVTVTVGSLIQELSCSVTVSAAQQPDNGQEKNNDDEKNGDEKNDGQDSVYTKVVISGATEVLVGKTITLSAQTEPQGGKITWSSDNNNVAKVDSAGVVTGVAAGTVNIKAVCSEATEIAATYQITVKSAVDGGAKLKDKDGSQMYYQDSSGEYREATYDDYTKYDRFYKKSSVATEYRYTGWQTIDGNVYFFDKNGNYVTGEQVIQGVKYTFGSDGKLSSGSGTMGIDVSKHNGNIDWNAVKNSGVSFVIIRCGYRGSATGVLVEDPMFRSNIKGAKAAGLKVGVYFFCQAVNEVEAVEEASMAVGLVSGYGLDMPIFLDVESANGGRGDKISKETRTAVCKAFCQTVQNSGYTAGIYANKTWFNEKINTSSLTNYKIWLAQYASEPTYTTTRYDMWQYSSKGRISGISTNVDLDIRYY